MASINRLSPILAIAVGVLHAGLAPVLAASDVQPNIALVAVVLVTCWAGAVSGAVWAFLAGLTVNVLSSQPIGSIPFSLLAAAALAAVARPWSAPFGAFYPVGAVVLGSIVADAAMLAIDRVSGGPAGALPLDVVAIGGALNGALAAVVVVAAWLIRRGGDGRERVTRWNA